MTETEIDYSKVSRNDPCPCGSGKKFKKCHFRTLQLQQETQKQTVSLDNFIKKDQQPYFWFKGLTLIINRRDWALLYETFAPDSPIREKYPTASSFVQVSRDAPSEVLGGGDFDLRRFRVIGDHAFIMGARGLEERRGSTVTYEVLSLVDSEVGYQIAEVECIDIPKDEVGDEDLPFERFECVQRVYAEARKADIVRPEIEHPEIDESLLIKI